MLKQLINSLLCQQITASLPPSSEKPPSAADGGSHRESETENAVLTRVYTPLIPKVWEPVVGVLTRTHLCMQLGSCAQNPQRLSQTKPNVQRAVGHTILPWTVERLTKTHRERWGQFPQSVGLVT